MALIKNMLFGPVLMVTMLLLALIGGCAPNYDVGPAALPAESNGFPLTLEDDLGRTVTLERRPQRIISLAPSNTEILFALGLGDRIAGVTQYCDFPEEARSKPKVGGFATADIERIVSLSPDLVVATRIHDKEVIPALTRIGLTTIALSPKTVDGVVDSIVLIAAATGSREMAATLTASLRSRIDAIATKTTGINDAERPRVLHVNWHDPIKAAGKDTFTDDLMKKAGGINIARDFSGFKAMSLESIVSRNPEVVIVSAMSTSNHIVYNAIMAESRLSSIDARTKGRVYEIDSVIIDRPGPRLVTALEQIVRWIHPGKFK